MKVSVPFGYYRSEPGQLVSTPVVEFIDAEAPELSHSEIRAAAYYSVHGEPVECLWHEGDFLVPLDIRGRPFGAGHMPTPGRKRSAPEMAFQLMRLMPMLRCIVFSRESGAVRAEKNRKARGIARPRDHRPVDGPAGNGRPV